MPHLGKDPTTGHLVKAASGHLAFDCGGDFCTEESPLTVSIVESGTTYDETFSVSSSDLVYFRFRAQGDFKFKIFVGGILKYDSGCILGAATFFDSGGGPIARLRPAHRFGVVGVSGTETLRLVVEDCDPGFTAPAPLLPAFSPRFWDFTVGCECSVLEGFEVVKMFPALTSPFLPGYEQGTTDWVSPWEHTLALDYGIQMDMSFNSSANSLLVDFDATNFLTTGTIFGSGFFPGPTGADFFLLPTPAATATIHYKQEFVGSPTDIVSGVRILCSSSSSSSTSSSSSSTSVSSSSTSSSSSSTSCAVDFIDVFDATDTTTITTLPDNFVITPTPTGIIKVLVGAARGADDGPAYDPGSPLFDINTSILVDGVPQYTTGCIGDTGTPPFTVPTQQQATGVVDASGAAEVRVVTTLCPTAEIQSDYTFTVFVNWHLELTYCL